MRQAGARMTALNAALCLLLLFAQTVYLGHSHDADLQSRFDCEICLKGGSVDDLLVPGSTNLPALVSSQSFPVLVQSQTFSAPTTATARAPPSYT